MGPCRGGGGSAGATSADEGSLPFASYVPAAVGPTTAGPPTGAVHLAAECCVVWPWATTNAVAPAAGAAPLYPTPGGDLGGTSQLLLLPGDKHGALLPGTRDEAVAWECVFDGYATPPPGTFWAAADVVPSAAGANGEVVYVMQAHMVRVSQGSAPVHDCSSPLLRPLYLGVCSSSFEELQWG